MFQHLNKYLQKHAIYPPLIKTAPVSGLKTIVIIPAYNEPGILSTLESLKHCQKSIYPVEVIILLNHGEHTAEPIKKQNKDSESVINQWAKINNTSQLSFFALYINKLPQKQAGAGLARKIAMDEAIRRFEACQQEVGIIASLDADTLVSENYLSDLEQAFINNPRLNAVSFNFEHPIASVNPKSDPTEPIVLYELYLRYYKQALASTGFPYAFYTIGSCFAVSANAYVQQGGMNRRQAGEDFYFLNKIFPLGNCKELNHITVYPSSRYSNRVPFGTGPALQKIRTEGFWLSYKPAYFDDLATLFSAIPGLFDLNDAAFEQAYNHFPETIKTFLPYKIFAQHWLEIKKHTASKNAFVHRFFRWFDAFQIIKFLNFHHGNNAAKIPVNEAAALLLKHKFPHLHAAQNTPWALLQQFRNLDLGI